LPYERDSGSERDGNGNGIEDEVKGGRE